MPPAVIAGGIAAAGAIGGAVLSSSAQKKAANQANASQQQATQAQLQLGRESMALNRDIYNSNYATLSPFVSRGNVAGDAINALLGLPAAPQMQSPLAPSAAHAPVTSTGGQSSADRNLALRMNTANPRNPYIGNLNTVHRSTTVADDPAAPGGYFSADTDTGGVPAATQTAGAQATSAPAASAVTPQSATSALNNFANSAGMQFQLEQGANALNNLYAAHGQLQSGAAMRAMQGFGQKTALNNYFMPYMGLLSGQQSIGAGSASSIAGVGQNFGNTAAAINGQMGSAIQGGADAASNAALLRGQANANMWGTVGSSLGTLASSFVNPTTGGWRF